MFIFKETKMGVIKKVKKVKNYYHLNVVTIDGFFIDFVIHQNNLLSILNRLTINIDILHSIIEYNKDKNDHCHLIKIYNN